MVIFKKTILIIISILITSGLLGSTTLNSPTTLTTNNNTNNTNVINIGVLLYSFDDMYLSKFKQSLENIQTKNQNQVNFVFFDGRNNVSVQREILDSVLKNRLDLLIINLADTKEPIVEEVIYSVKQKNIPLIMLGIDSQVISAVNKDYDKAFFTVFNSKDAGTLQGKILVDFWNTNKGFIDKNDDNILQYIMLQGDSDSPTSKDRTNYSISTINNSGIKTKKLVSMVANWDKELAKIETNAVFLRYAGNIEAIIANNDAMAIGAIEALQQYGYNKGDKSKYIPVVGVDGLPEAKDLIDKELMTGTVIQDSDIMAEAFYNISMNLINKEYSLESTNYKIKNNLIEIEIPYEEYIKRQ